MRRIDVRYTKWPDRIHYEYAVRVLGEDEHGVWAACDAGDAVHKAGAFAFNRPTTLLKLIPRGDEHWTGLWHPPDDPKWDLYLDINTPPEWNGDAVTMIDLDLDVQRLRDGSVHLLDEDELEAHSIEYGYPDDLVAMTRAAAHDVFDRITAGVEPFVDAPRRWMDELYG
jgi:hypothetical protein